MAEISTAEEFWFKNTGQNINQEEYSAMIEFAKMHVEAALKAKANAMTEKSYEDSSYSMGELDAFTKDSYPLTNIKQYGTIQSNTNNSTLMGYCTNPTRNTKTPKKQII